MLFNFIKSFFATFHQLHQIVTSSLRHQYSITYTLFCLVEMRAKTLKLFIHRGSPNAGSGGLTVSPKIFNMIYIF